ncbi:MAG: hypothetical protein JU82_07710 [Sulfuricurvum sp. MLSB]|uniref:hypothetical protein n=1 Tax=unclassified Sulfuricurvum TaxID=2632390 RepID=UPI0005016538|nr:MULTISPECIES: hypothetical protein [unclassified Sulfuricurvum]KFN39295.1 MAG: hypothetical protein JU82_07710 [Sulfuricurvum sp. MLSB]
MKINLAHLRERSTTGGWIDFIVFDAKSTTNNNKQLLIELTSKARMNGLKVDKSALAYETNGRLEFYGTKDLVEYLSNIGLPQWTHTIDI